MCDMTNHAVGAAEKTILPLFERPQIGPAISPAIAAVGSLTLLFGLWTVYTGYRCVSSAAQFSEIFFEPLSDECADAQSNAVLTLEISALFFIFVKGILPYNEQQE